METAVVAAELAIQFRSILLRSPADIEPIQRDVAKSYANKVRDSIMRRTRQISDSQSYYRRVQFLSGVEVCEISMAEWVEANESFKPF